MVISSREINKVLELISQGKVHIELDAALDILKQGYSWDTKFIIECLREGRHFEGKELYENHPTLPIKEIQKRIRRKYCIRKISLWGKLVIIAYYLQNEIVVIHICPLNKKSREGKIFYNTL